MNRDLTPRLRLAQARRRRHGRRPVSRRRGRAARASKSRHEVHPAQRAQLLARPVRQRVAVQAQRAEMILVAIGVVGGGAVADQRGRRAGAQGSTQRVGRRARRRLRACARGRRPPGPSPIPGSPSHGRGTVRRPADRCAVAPKARRSALACATLHAARVLRSTSARLSWNGASSAAARLGRARHRAGQRVLRARRARRSGTATASESSELRALAAQLTAAFCSSMPCGLQVCWPRCRIDQSIDHHRALLGIRSASTVWRGSAGSFCASAPPAHRWPAITAWSERPLLAEQPPTGALRQPAPLENTTARQPPHVAAHCSASARDQLGVFIQCGTPFSNGAIGCAQLFAERHPRMISAARVWRTLRVGRVGTPGLGPAGARRTGRGRHLWRHDGRWCGRCSAAACRGDGRELHATRRCQPPMAGSTACARRSRSSRPVVGSALLRLAQAAQRPSALRSQGHGRVAPAGSNQATRDGRRAERADDRRSAMVSGATRCSGGNGSSNGGGLAARYSPRVRHSGGLRRVGWECRGSRARWRRLRRPARFACARCAARSSRPHSQRVIDRAQSARCSGLRRDRERHHQSRRTSRATDLGGVRPTGDRVVHHRAERAAGRSTRPCVIDGISAYCSTGVKAAPLQERRRRVRARRRLNRRRAAPKSAAAGVLSSSSSRMLSWAMSRWKHSSVASHRSGVEQLAQLHQQPSLPAAPAPRLSSAVFHVTPWISGITMGGGAVRLPEAVHL